MRDLTLNELNQVTGATGDGSTDWVPNAESSLGATLNDIAYITNEIGTALGSWGYDTATDIGELWDDIF